MLIVRHGQSEFNRHFREVGGDPGIEDPRLTLLGLRQTEGIVSELRDHHRVERLITSPYTRALQTAVMIAEALSLPVEIDPLVGERRNWTCDIGAPRSVLEERWPRLDLGALEERWWPEESETGAEVSRRAMLFLMKVGAADDAVVVTHCGFIRALTGEYVPTGGWIGW